MKAGMEVEEQSDIPIVLLPAIALLRLTDP